MAKLREPVRHRDFIAIDKNYEAAAEAANLIYVNDQTEGIRRERAGKGFRYLFKEKAVSEDQTLSRIKSLVIPPAWTDVWIAPSANAHIQATGYDVAGRKQYRYHHRWSALQQETKFHRMYQFGKALPSIREALNADLAQQGFPESKVLAMVVSIMDHTHIRVGNEGYEKLYGSYGLTTMKNKHVTVQGDTITFSFKGKKGVYHKISLKNKRFASAVRKCKSIPGSELFQYYDADGNVKKVDSGQVNQYIKMISGEAFTTKDFRTWAGTMTMLGLLKTSAPCNSLSEYKRSVNNALKEVSTKLGNTVAVCRKYYVHPELINLYQQNQLERHFKTTASAKAPSKGLSAEEALLMKILNLIQREKVNPTVTKRLLKQSIQKVRRSRKLSPSTG